MKTARLICILLTLALLLTGCGPQPVPTEPSTVPPSAPPTEPATQPPTAPPTEPPTDPPTTPPTEPTTDPTGEPVIPVTTEILLSDDSVLANGTPAGTDPEAAVYVANDIVYYEEGHDFTYGEGEKSDEHTFDEAAAHTVVHITKAGTYILSGTLSKGQIAVDLGEDAEEDASAVVTLILNGVDINCDVAPAVIFYNVYECGSDDTEAATYEVDTSAAGANVIIADGTENTVRGSHVARIYKPGTVVLNADGTAVDDAKKLHKYDAAFYSKKTMNVTGGELGTGVLNIYADNEGMDSELHLTINGGNINIFSGNDGINTNEDGVSVTTINGGTLMIQVTGETGEGDGIDSNGWLVINGGTVTAAACSFSGDAGIDSDMGIHINGGTVIATGSMLDHIENGGQSYVVFSFSQKQDGKNPITLKNEAGEAILDHVPENNFSILVFSSPDLVEGTYTLWSNGIQQAGVAGGVEGFPGMPGGSMGGGPGGSMGGEPGGSEGGEPPVGEGPQSPEGGAPGGSEGGEPPVGEGPQPPEGGAPGGSEGGEPPVGEGPQSPEGGAPGGSEGGEPPAENGDTAQERATEFLIVGNENTFSQVGPAA